MGTMLLIIGGMEAVYSVYVCAHETDEGYKCVYVGNKTININISILTFDVE